MYFSLIHSGPSQQPSSVIGVLLSTSNLLDLIMTPGTISFLAFKFTSPQEEPFYYKYSLTSLLNPVMHFG